MQQDLAILERVEQHLLQPPRPAPRAEHLEPFLEAARQVIEAELGSNVSRGKLTLADGGCTTHEITAIIGITGKLVGLAIFGMQNSTALAIVGHMMGAPIEEMDDLALSGIAELANVIAGRAATLLTERGLFADIAPPVLLCGAGSRVSTAGITRLVVPLLSSLGTVEIQLAIKGNT